MSNHHGNDVVIHAQDVPHSSKALSTKDIKPAAIGQDESNKGGWDAISHLKTTVSGYVLGAANYFVSSKKLDTTPLNENDQQHGENSNGRQGHPHELIEEDSQQHSLNSATETLKASNSDVNASPSKPKEVKHDVLEKLEKVQAESLQNIKDLAKERGREDIFIGGDLNEGSFAFKLNDGNVQFAKNLKQLADHLEKEEDFKISEEELGKQLQIDKTVENDGKKIEIEILGAKDAEQQVQEEVKKRKEQVQTFVVEILGKGLEWKSKEVYKVNGGFWLNHNLDDVKSKLKGVSLSDDYLDKIKKGEDSEFRDDKDNLVCRVKGETFELFNSEGTRVYHIEKLNLERIDQELKKREKEYNNVIKDIDGKITNREIVEEINRKSHCLENKCDEMKKWQKKQIDYLKEMQKRYPEIKIEENDANLYEIKINGKIDDFEYLNNEDEIKAKNAEKDGTEVRKLGLDETVERVEILYRKDRMEEMADKLDHDISGGKKLGGWEEPVAYRLDGKIYLVEDKTKLVESVGGHFELGDDFTAERTEAFFARMDELESVDRTEFEGKKVEVIEFKEAWQDLQQEVSLLEQREAMLAVAHWPKSYKKDQSRVYDYTKVEGHSDGETTNTTPAKGFAASPDLETLQKYYKLTDDEVKNLKDNKPAHHDYGDGRTLDLTPAKLYDAVNYLEKLSKQDIKVLHKEFTGIEIKSDKAHGHTFRGKLYITERSELKADDPNLQQQGMSGEDINALNDIGALEEADKPKQVETEIALKELQERKAIKDIATQLIRKDISIGVDLYKGSLIPYREEGSLVQLTKDRDDIAKHFNVTPEAKDGFYAELAANGHVNIDGKKIEIMLPDEARQELAKELELQNQVEEYITDRFGPKDTMAKMDVKSDSIEFTTKDGNEIKLELIKLELIKLEEAKQKMEELYKDMNDSVKEDLEELTGIELTSDKVYAHKFRKKLYITESSELKVDDPDLQHLQQRLRQQGMSEEDINALKNVGALGEADKPERIGLDEAKTELDQLNGLQKEIKGMAKELDLEGICGKSVDPSKWKGFVAYTRDGKVQLAENKQKMADDLGVDVGELAGLKEGDPATIKTINEQKIELLEWDKARKELENDVSIQTQSVQDLVKKLWGYTYSKERACVYKVNDGGSKYKDAYLTGWATEDEWKEKLEKDYKKYNLSVSGADLEKMKKGEKCDIIGKSNDNKEIVVEVQLLDWEQRVQYLKGELKDKYIGEIKEFEKELSGQTIGPEKVPYQVTVDGKPEVRFYESTDQELTNLGENAVQMNLKKMENHLKGLENRRKSQIGHLKDMATRYSDDIRVSGEEIHLYEISVNGKDKPDFQYLDSEETVDAEKRKEGVTGVRKMGLDEIVEHMNEKHKEQEIEHYKPHIKEALDKLGRDISEGEDFRTWKEPIAFRIDGEVQLAKDDTDVAARLKGYFKIDAAGEADFNTQLQGLNNVKSMEFDGKTVEIIKLKEASQHLQDEVAHLEQRKSELATAYWSSFEGKAVYPCRKANDKFVYYNDEGHFTRLHGILSSDIDKIKSDEVVLDKKGKKIEEKPAGLDSAVEDLERMCKKESKSIKGLHEYVKEGIKILNDTDVEPEVVYAYEINNNLYITGNPKLETRDLEKLKNQGLDVPQEDIDQFGEAKRIGLPEAKQKLEDQKIEKLAKEVGEEKYAYKVTIFGKPGGILFYESPTAMADDWGIPSDKRADLGKGKHSYDSGSLKLERLSSEDTIEELEKQKYLLYSKNEIKSAIEDIMKKDLREKLKNDIVYEYTDSDGKHNYHVGNSTTAKAYFGKSVYPSVKEVKKNSVRASILREGEVRWLANKIQIYQYKDRICATADPEVAKGILGVEDANLKLVDRSAWDKDTLKLYKTEKQAFNQLQTLMEKDLGYKPEVIFAYKDQNDDSKKAVAPTIEEIAEKLLPANKKFSKDNLINKKKRMLEDLEKNAEHVTYSKALKWYQKRYIKNRYEEVNDKELNGSMADPDQIYGCNVYVGDNKNPRFREIAQDSNKMAKRLQDQGLTISAQDMKSGDRYKVVDQDDDPILTDHKEVEIEPLGLEGKIQLLGDLAKKRTDNIKKDHKFVFGKAIQSENVCGYMVIRHGDGTKQFYSADDFPDLVQDLQNLKKKGSLPLGWKDLDKLAQKELKVSDKPYKVDTDNPRFKRFGPKIEVRRIGLESTEEGMQKMYINKLYSIIEQNNEPTLKTDPKIIKISDSVERGKKIKELEADAKERVNRIKALQKDVYNEDPNADAKWEESCGYLVGKVFYTRERFQHWALKEDMSKPLDVGDPSSDPSSDPPSHKHITKSGVRYEIRRLGLKRTEQELEKSQKIINRRLEQLLRLPKTDKKYRTYRIVREIDDKGHWIKDHSTIDIDDIKNNTRSLEDNIKKTYFEDKEIELGEVPSDKLTEKKLGESVEYTSKDKKMRIKVERIAENKACEELDKGERKHIKDISDLQKKFGYKTSDDICGGKSVDKWKQMYGYKFGILDATGKKLSQVLQVAESPGEMAQRLATYGIKDKKGNIAKELSDMHNRDNKAKNYEFTTEILGEDGKKSEIKFVVEKAEISEVKAKMEKNITDTRKELIERLRLYDQANQWNYKKIYAGNYKDWGEDFCFAEVDGKLRFGKTLKDIEKAFPDGKVYNDNISPYAAVPKLERLTLDHGARNTLMESVYIEKRERVKEAFPDVNFDDPKVKIKYRFEFLSAEEHYHFELGNKCYIGASLTDAADFFGVPPKELVKLSKLTEVGDDGYFKGSSGKIKRHQMDSKTVEVALANRDQWAMDPIHMFKDAEGNIWFTDNKNLGGLPEFRDKGMMLMSEEGINIRNVVNPNPLDMPKIKVDLTDPNKEKSDSEDGDDSEDSKQLIVPLPTLPSLDPWLFNPLNTSIAVSA